MSFQVELGRIVIEPPIAGLSMQAGAFLDYDPVIYIMLDESERVSADSVEKRGYLRQQARKQRCETAN